LTSVVPANGPLRLIRRIVNAALAGRDAEFEALYAKEGRPSSCARLSVITPSRSAGRPSEGRLLQPPANHHQPGSVPEQDLHLLCHVDGMGKTDAARLFGIDQKTVATILKHSAAAGYRRIRPPVSPKPDRFIPFIDEILENDGGELKK